MLSREQRLMLFKARHTSNCLFKLPPDLIREISQFGRDDTEFNKALHHAASSQEEDIDIVVEKVKANPSLLLQTGNVVTRAGISVIRTTLYEFFLGEGDPDAAKQIEPYFAEIPNGENERIRQYEQYRPHIEALAKQVESSQPAFDLRPLFKIIKESSAADILDALNINDPNRNITENENTALRAALAEFRKAVKPKCSITVGMHYEHYTTLEQAFDLLHRNWKALSDNYAHYERCYLVWRQIIGYLQRSLPAVDRFGFARAFEDKKRSLCFKHDDKDSFPDVISTDGNLEFSGLGFDKAIFGAGGNGWGVGWMVGKARFRNTCRAKTSSLQNLCSDVRNQKQI